MLKKPHGYDGLLIVIEGTDGSGKSTQVNMLSQYVKDKCFGVTVSEWVVQVLEYNERRILWQIAQTV